MKNVKETLDASYLDSQQPSFTTCRSAFFGWHRPPRVGSLSSKNGTDDICFCQRIWRILVPEPNHESVMNRSPDGEFK